MSLSLTHEIFDPSMACSLESANSACGLRQVPIRPFGNATSAEMCPQKFHNVRSKRHFLLGIKLLIEVMNVRTVDF